MWVFLSSFVVLDLLREVHFFGVFVIDRRREAIKSEHSLQEDSPVPGSLIFIHGTRLRTLSRTTVSSRAVNSVWKDLQVWSRAIAVSSDTWPKIRVKMSAGRLFIVVLKRLKSIKEKRLKSR